MTKEGSIFPSRSDPELRHIVLHGRLGHAKGKAAIDGRAHGDLVQEAAIDADDGDRAEVSAAMDGLAEHVGPVRPHEGRDLDRSTMESKLACVSGSVPTASMQASAPRPLVRSWMRS